MASWEPTDPQEFFELRAAHTREELAEIYHVSFEQIKHYLSKLRRDAKTVQKKTSPEVATSKEGPDGLVISTGVSADGTKTETRLVNREIRSVEELMELYQVDPAEWDVVDFKCKSGSWDGFWKDSDNNAQVKTLYTHSCEARFRPTKRIVRDFLMEARNMIEEAKAYMPQYPTIIRTRTPEQHEHCLQINIPDLHMGKRAWGEEVGGANYDVDIAEALFFEAVESALAYGKTFDLGKIVFPIGNDLLNCDNSNNTTQAGTPQDADGRQKKTFRRTRQMIQTGLEMCRELAPVYAPIIPGNHDPDSVFALGDALQGWLHNATDVTIDNAAFHMKAFEWGANAIMLTHGEEKMADLALTFAEAFPDIWARATHRQVYCGHLHTMKAQDFRGCWVTFISSLTGTDYWHARHNYKSRRAALFCVWQRDGRQSYFENFNAPYNRVLQALS